MIRVVSCVVGFYHLNANNHELDRRYNDKKTSLDVLELHSAEFLRLLLEDDRLAKEGVKSAESFFQWDAFASKLDGIEMIIDLEINEDELNVCE